MEMQKENLYGRMLKAGGARLGDTLTITPAVGKRTKRDMNRTSFIVTNDRTTKESSQIILLDFHEEGNFSYEISLTGSLGDKKRHKEGRFFCKSLCDKPFKINGNWSTGCFVERGDHLEFGYNRVHIQGPDLSERPLPFPQTWVESELPILLEGPTGSGKTHLARKIHEISARRGHFIHLNLSAIPVNLLESELFGHKKGAFTGAVQDKKGACQAADEGTLFLDEIDSLSFELQVKLLLFLDSGEFTPVGSVLPLKTNAKILLASGQPLRNLVETQKLRKDLYYRLTAGHAWRLPGLGGNREMILKIVREFERKYFVACSPGLVRFYQECPWPGNIRQLLTHLKRKRYQSPNSKLCLADEDLYLKEESFENKPSQRFSTLKEIKSWYSHWVFYQSGEDRLKAARFLGISSQTLGKILMAA